MRILRDFALPIGLAFASAAASAEYYKVSVTRLDTNLYKTDSGLFIKTKFCLELALSEEAILKYEQYSYDNKLIFVSSRTNCDVERVFK